MRSPWLLVSFLAVSLVLTQPAHLYPDHCPKGTYIISAKRTGSCHAQGRQMIMVTATAYSYTGHRTKSGTWPQRGTVAVDPRIIPLGTRLYVEGYGPAVATDTGADIKGARIDEYRESAAECVQLGRKTVAVWIVN
jgi:3D (Asp-Asp-Asp) domain-containing protein